MTFPQWHVDEDKVDEVDEENEEQSKLSISEPWKASPVEFRSVFGCSATNLGRGGSLNGRIVGVVSTVKLFTVCS